MPACIQFFCPLLLANLFGILLILGMDLLSEFPGPTGPSPLPPPIIGDADGRYPNGRVTKTPAMF